MGGRGDGWEPDNGGWLVRDSKYCTRSWRLFKSLSMMTILRSRFGYTQASSLLTLLQLAHAGFSPEQRIFESLQRVQA